MKIQPVSTSPNAREREEEAEKPLSIALRPKIISLLPYKNSQQVEASCCYSSMFIEGGRFGQDGWMDGRMSSVDAGR